MHDDSEKQVSAIEYDFYCKKIAVAFRNRTISVYSIKDTRSYEFICNWQAHFGEIIKLLWTDPLCGNRIFSASHDGNVVCWEESFSRNSEDKKTVTYKQIHAFNDCSSQITDIDLSYIVPDCKIALFTASTDKCLRIYRLEDSFILSTWKLAFQFCFDYPLSCVSAHDNPLISPFVAIGFNCSMDITNTVKFNSEKTNMAFVKYNATDKMWQMFPKLNLFLFGQNESSDIVSVNRDDLLTLNNILTGENIFDVRFANSMCRSFLHLAVITAKMNVLLLKITSNESVPFSISCVKIFNMEHSFNSQFTKIRWNRFGNYFITAGHSLNSLHVFSLNKNECTWSSLALSNFLSSDYYHDKQDMYIIDLARFNSLMMEKEHLSLFSKNSKKLIW